MAKLSLSRLFDTAQTLSTDVGQQISDFIDYTAEFAKQTLTALKNSLNFTDNFDCTPSTVSLTHNVPQIVATTKTPTGVLITRVYSTTALLSGWLWYLDNNNNLVVTATFSTFPSSPVQVSLVILYS